MCRRAEGVRYHESMIEVSFWPILAAGVASVLIGWVWYHPKVFGSAWMRMSQITPEMAERGKKRMPVMALAALLASMLVAYVMSFMGPFLVYPDLLGAFELGFWIWIGFVAPAMLGMVLWEQKPIRLYLINALYWLVVLVVMALILVVGSQQFSANALPGEADTSSFVAE